ncbi:MAG: fumarylacetoacetase [Steroidobacteraceae bacterium]
MLNQTHDASRHSWVNSANQADGDFPLQNLPHGVFRHGNAAARGGIAIGDQILDLQAALRLKLFNAEQAEIATAAAESSLNRYLSMGNNAAQTLRARIFELLDQDSGRQLATQREQLLIPMAQVQMQLPVYSRSYSDFCTSIPHVTANRRARPGRPAHNLKHLPIGYGGRASSIVVDGTSIPRPWGHGSNETTGENYYSPTHRMDFELEFGAYLCAGNTLGSTLPMNRADAAIFGYVLVNDWSARDIQRFENLLGPFLGKSFATTVSPWLVTQAALAPFRTSPVPRPADDPPLRPHLNSAEHERTGALDVRLQAWLSTARMRAQGLPPQCITDTNLLHLYWTLPQMVAHHASNGCNLEVGDLIASGTVSGPEEHQAACMWEITGGSLPIELPTGEQRLWLEDGDELSLTGRADKAGHTGIGFGTCRGVVQTALQSYP